jgi:hypothetical protein
MYYSIIEITETQPNPRITSTLLILLGLSLKFYGAGRGGRTPTTLRSADFESAASASSAIPALGGAVSLTRTPYSPHFGRMQRHIDRRLRRTSSATASAGPASELLYTDTCARTRRNSLECLSRARPATTRGHPSGLDKCHRSSRGRGRYPHLHIRE